VRDYYDALSTSSVHIATVSCQLWLVVSTNMKEQDFILMYSNGDLDILVTRLGESFKQGAGAYKEHQVRAG